MIPCLIAISLATIGAAPVEVKPYGLPKRVPWTTSRLVGTPEPPPEYTVARAFPRLKFKGPVYIAQEPGTDRIIVAELTGKIFAFDKNKADPKNLELFLDTGRQIYSFSFHPKYEKTGEIFVFSPTDPRLDGKKVEQRSRVSRFIARGEPRKCSPDSEKIIVEWKGGGHNGGEAIIGPDGYLYVCTGDQTSTSDGNETGQGVDDLLSVVMRLDLDNPPPGKAYGIPKDNPFVNFPGARPEIWAFGFRNPWRMSFDQKTGAMWISDVGQDLWEMLRLVERGGNYGWSVQEGSHPFLPQRKAGPGPILPPTVEHHHSECRSITGGYVYYGSKFPELHGVYFYGDYEYGRIWGLRYNPKATPSKDSRSGPKANQHPGRIIHSVHVTWHADLAHTSLKIASFGVSRSGDIYIVDHATGEIHELERAKVDRPPHPFPRKLSETGLFASVKDHKPAAGVVPFTVIVPQWLDGAVAERFVALPAKTFIRGGPDSWHFDNAIAAVQTIFHVGQVSNLPTSTSPKDRISAPRRLETRVLIQQKDQWLGYSYLWNDEQTDADLVDGLGKDLVLEIDDRDVPTKKRRQTWHIPSRNECMFCHSRAASFILGLRTVQLNRDHDYGGIVDNQLRAFSHAGIFKEPLVEQHLYPPPPAKEKDKPARSVPTKQPRDYKAFPSVFDSGADLNLRARAYLHVHCSVCHVGDGGGNSKFQIRHDTPDKQMYLVGESPLHGTFGLENGKLVAPGDPFASVLLYRFSKLGRGHMPHIGSSVIHAEAQNLLHDWIVRMDDKGQVDPKKLTEHSEYRTTLSRLEELKDTERTAEFRKLLGSTRTAFILACLLGREKKLAPHRGEILALAAAVPSADIRDLFEPFLPEERRTRRLGDFVNPRDVLTLRGDAAAGKNFFFAGNASLCRNCHKIGNEGGSLGPDLSKIGGKLKRHELLESLLEPSKIIDAQYKTHVLITHAGQVLTGIVTEKTPQHVAINVLEAGQPKLVRVAAVDVDQLLPQTKSMMPDGLLRDLTPQQAADLIEYLSTLK